MKDKIINVLNNGGVVAIKTDTVYGLIANALNENAVKKIYDIKKRDNNKPLCIFIKNISELNKYTDNILKNNVLDLLKKYWPGKLTVIFNKKKGILDNLVKGRNGIGIRIPDDKLLLEVLNNIDYPLAETSCNVEGENPCETYGEIKSKFMDKIDLIVDGGKVYSNVPSTIVSIESGEMFIIRKGAINIG